MRRRHSILLVCAVALAACAPLPRDGAIAVTRGLILERAGSELPAANDPGWRPVELSDIWSNARRRKTSEAWYRFDVALPQAPAELWAVYLPRLVMNAGAYVNGEFVGDGGPFSPTPSRNWNRPLFFSIPAGLLRAGPNRLDVRIATNPTSPGILQAFVLGPERQLRPAYERRYFLQVTMSAISAGATLVTALLVGVIFARRSRDRQYAWFVAGVLAWTWSTVDTLVQQPRLPPRLFEWTTQVAINLVAPCFVVGLHRALRLERPGIESVIALLTLAGMVALATVPPLVHFPAYLAWLSWTLVLAGYAITLLTAAARASAPTGARQFLGAAAMALAFGAWDVGGILSGTTGGRPLVSTFIPPLVMVAAGWALLGRIAVGLDEAERLNEQLERRVADKAAELERNYDRLRQLERERAVTAERERIMQDMHDGMGGQLVSTLALVESGAAGAEDVADALRAALDDMRLVIDSLDPVEGDVLSVLGLVRGRLEPRLNRHGLRFDWQVQDLPPVAGFGAEQALQLLRIVQEAITNVVKHARATTITVRTAASPDAAGTAGVVVEVADDGQGSAATAPAGRGLANMRRRARALGGTLAIRTGGPGTVVHLWLPLVAPAA